MPEIPLITESPQMEFRAPVEGENPSASRKLGEAISSAGAGLEKFGMDSAEISNRKEAAQRNLDIQEAKQTYVQAALNAQDRAISEAKPDGSDLVEIFDKHYTDATKDVADNYDNLLSQKGANIQNLNVSNQFKRSLMDKSRKMFQQNLEDTTSGINSRASQIVWQDPSQLDAQKDVLFQTYMGNSSTFAQHKDAAEDGFNTGVEQLYRTAINRYIDKDDFGSAKEIFRSRLAPMLDPEDQEKVQKQIYQAQTERDDQIIRSNKMQKDTDKNRQDALIKKNYEALATGINNTNDPKELNDLDNQARALLANDQLDRNHYNLLKEIEKGAAAPPSDGRISSGFFEKLTSGDYDLTKLRGEVTQARHDGLIGSQSEVRLLNGIQAREHSTKNPFNSSRAWSAAMKEVDDHFGGTGAFDQPTPMQRIQREQIKQQIIKDTAAGMNVMDAKDKELKKAFGISPIFVPGVAKFNQEDPGAIVKQRDQIKQDLQSGKVSQREYNEWLKSATQQLNYISAQKKQVGK